MKKSRLNQKADLIFQQARLGNVTTERRGELAIELAALILEEARRIQTYKEKKIQNKLAKMIKDPNGKAFTTALTDQCFRSQNSERIADQIHYLIEKFGIPDYLGSFERLLFRIFERFGKKFSFLFVPLIKRQLRKETTSIVLPGERNELRRQIIDRQKNGYTVNLNHIGEAILGEKEADKRLKTYIEDLQRPEVEYISVKISSICSQINLVAWEETLNILSKRLKCLYREASSNYIERSDGKKVPKFVNLDMEEYKDLHMTVEVFLFTLNDPEFLQFKAGIVLQSYLPDSYYIQQRITEWAKKRVEKGGAPIKIRIVKGANLAMEKVEASLKGWELATYDCKTKVDANFKKMVHYGCLPENAKAVHLGIASHNLFDIAYAMLLREEHHLDDEVCFEMLEGMANHIRRAVQELSNGMIIYCPAAKTDDFQNAMAYLIRRLDENATPENFLYDSFNMRLNSLEWTTQEKMFFSSLKMKDSIMINPKRKQDRLIEIIKRNRSDVFVNEPDTDWSLPQNQIWAETIISEWKNRKNEKIPVVVGGREIYDSNRLIKGIDPSVLDHESYTYTYANENELNIALETALNAQPLWGSTTLLERSILLCQIADTLRKNRNKLIGAMIDDGGKIITEADAEVSEAIDFAEYYLRSFEELSQLRDIEWKPKGTIVVAPPWNFPVSIPAGGILSALITGNCVIFKPAPEAVLVGWILVNLFWEAGISKEVLQFFPCEDEPIAESLIKDSRVNGVIFTGGTVTARRLKELNPKLDLMAETGGKNAIIVTELADRDLAIKDIIQSAFGHSGQKCSACSLLICLPEIYNDEKFRELLADAASSLKVGSSWELETKINPLIRKPEGNLEWALHALDEGESWLLKPKNDQNNPYLWSPGIKLGVKPGSKSHLTEFFGPVLSVMLANDLDHAIEIANGTPYGLTSGLHSLDQREHAIWLSKIKAGNLYINRGITGAIVLRQPFGGCKASSFGRGIKAGGPNYLTQLMRAEQIKLFDKESDDETGLKNMFKEGSEAEVKIWSASLASYEYYWKNIFSIERDFVNLLGQNNILRYVPREKMTLRMTPKDRLLDVFRIIAAVLTCNGKLEISAQERFKINHPKITMICEPDEEFISRIKEGDIPYLRILSPLTPPIVEAVAKSMTTVIDEPVLANGRLELLHYLREISISYDYHRYGNISLR